MKIETNDHHIIAKSDGGSNHPDNICEDIKIKTHRRVHDLFGNIRPHSQIDMLLDISYTAWLEDRIEKIDKLFKSFNGEYYKPHCIRPEGTKYKKSGHILIPE